jgi:hypothetical protein
MELRYDLKGTDAHLHVPQDITPDEIEELVEVLRYCAAQKRAPGVRVFDCELSGGEDAVSHS